MHFLGALHLVSYEKQVKFHRKGKHRKMSLIFPSDNWESILDFSAGTQREEHGAVWGRRMLYTTY